MKKVATFILLVGLCFSIIGCTNKAEDEQEIKEVIKIFEEAFQSKDLSLFLSIIVSNSPLEEMASSLISDSTVIIKSVKINSIDVKNKNATASLIMQFDEYIDQLERWVELEGIINVNLRKKVSWEIYDLGDSELAPGSTRPTLK